MTSAIPITANTYQCVSNGAPASGQPLDRLDHDHDAAAGQDRRLAERGQVLRPSVPIGWLRSAGGPPAGSRTASARRRPRRRSTRSRPRRGPGCRRPGRCRASEPPARWPRASISTPCRRLVGGRRLGYRRVVRNRPDSHRRDDRENARAPRPQHRRGRANPGPDGVARTQHRLRPGDPGPDGVARPHGRRAKRGPLLRWLKPLG